MVFLRFLYSFKDTDFFGVVEVIGWGGDLADTFSRGSLDLWGGEYSSRLRFCPIGLEYVELVSLDFLRLAPLYRMNYTFRSVERLLGVSDLVGWGCEEAHLSRMRAVMSDLRREEAQYLRVSTLDESCKYCTIDKFSDLSTPQN